MIKTFSKRMKNQKGFTLVELIVVIAIIGILGAIAVPRFGGFRETAGNAADKATADTIANAITILVADGTITPSGSNIAITYTGGNTNSFSSDDTNTHTELGKLDDLVGEITLNTVDSITFTIDPDGTVTHDVAD